MNDEHYSPRCAGSCELAEDYNIEINSLKSDNKSLKAEIKRLRKELKKPVGGSLYRRGHKEHDAPDTHRHPGH